MNTSIITHNEDINKIYAVIEPRIKSIFKTPDNAPHIQILAEQRLEVYEVGSSELRFLIESLAFQDLNILMTDSQQEKMEQLLRIKARQSKITQEIHVRTAETPEGIEIDLNNAAGECILVTAGKWEIAQPKSLFVRSKTLGEISYPIGGRGMGAFVKHFPTDEDGVRLLIGMAVYCLWPKGPYPVLNLKGSHGSGKSMTMDRIKSLVDPVTKGSRRSDIKKVEQLYIAANQNRVLTIDNISNIKGDISDALCCISTKGTYSARAHYTNGDEFLIELTRPVIFNGIPDVVSRSDLLSRMIVVEMMGLNENTDEETLNSQFEADKPYMLGYLLDGLASALKNRPNTQVTTSSRLADFLKVVTAASEGLEWEISSFQKIFENNQEISSGDILSLNPVSNALVSFMENRDQWQGTMTDLLEALNPYSGIEQHSQSWPKTARYLADALARIEKDLVKFGIKYEKYRTSTERKVTLTKLPEYKSNSEDGCIPVKDLSHLKHLFD